MAPLSPLRWKCRVVLQRLPDVGGGNQYVLERGRHHADDGVPSIIKGEVAADNLLNTPQSLPQGVADQHDGRTVDCIIRRLEITTDPWSDPQRPEVRRADALPFQSLGVIGTGQRRLPRTQHGQRLKGTTALDDFAIASEVTS